MEISRAVFSYLAAAGICCRSCKRFDKVLVARRCFILSEIVHSYQLSSTVLVFKMKTLQARLPRNFLPIYAETSLDGQSFCRVSDIRTREQSSKVYWVCGTLFCWNLLEVVLHASHLRYFCRLLTVR